MLIVFYNNINNEHQLQKLQQLDPGQRLFFMCFYDYFATGMLLEQGTRASVTKNVISVWNVLYRLETEE